MTKADRIAKEVALTTTDKLLPRAKELEHSSRNALQKWLADSYRAEAKLFRIEYARRTQGDGATKGRA